LSSEPQAGYTVHTKQATLPLNRHYVTVNKLENVRRT